MKAEPVQTPDLAELVRCERYASDFPRGMPLKACLRRQLERQGSVKQGELGPPRRPFCAAECAVGRDRRWACAGMELGACPRCGGALVGTAECPACAERALEERDGPARGFLPEIREPPSTRIWNGEAPDVAIGPAPAAPPPPPRCGLRAPEEPRPARQVTHAGGLTIVDEAPSREVGKSAMRAESARQATVARAESSGAPTSAQASPTQPVGPAEPGEAEIMACPECKSKTVHKHTCSHRPGGPKPGAKVYDPITHKPVKVHASGAESLRQFVRGPAFEKVARAAIRKGQRTSQSPLVVEFTRMQERVRARLNEIDVEVQVLFEERTKLAAMIGAPMTMSAEEAKAAQARAAG